MTNKTKRQKKKRMGKKPQRQDILSGSLSAEFGKNKKTEIKSPSEITTVIGAPPGP